MLYGDSMRKFVVVLTSLILVLTYAQGAAFSQVSLSGMTGQALIDLLKKQLLETTPASTQSMTSEQLRKRALLMQAIARELQARLRAQNRVPEENTNFRNARDRFNQLKVALKAANSRPAVAAGPSATPTPRPTPTPAPADPNIKLAARYKQTQCCAGDSPVTTTMHFSLNANGDYTFQERLADGRVTREGIATTSNENVWIQWDKHPTEDSYTGEATYQMKDGKLSLVSGSVRDPRGFDMQNCQSTIESENSNSKAAIPNAAVGAAGFLVLADPTGKDLLQLEGPAQITLGDHSGRAVNLFHPDKSGKMSGDGSFTCTGPDTNDPTKKPKPAERQITMVTPPAVIKEKQAVTLAASLSNGPGPKASAGWIVEGFDPSGKLGEVSVDAHLFSNIAKVRPVLSSPKFTITFGCYCNGATSWIKWTYKSIAPAETPPPVVAPPPRLPGLKAEGPLDDDISESAVFGTARPRVQPQVANRTSTLGTPSRYQRQDPPPYTPPPRVLPPVTSAASQANLSGAWIASYINLVNNNRGTYPVPMNIVQSGNQVSLVLPGEGANEAFRGVMNGNNVQLKHSRVQPNGFRNERYMMLNYSGGDTLDGELESRQTTPWGKTSITRFRYNFQRQAP